MRGIAIVIGALFMLSAAFYNGYPLVYSDTSTYLASGFEFKPPFDRPFTYGLFLRIASLNGLSLWLVVFFQALILSWLIFKFSCKFFPVNTISVLSVIVFLSLFTGLSWTASQLIADIFTPILLLTMAILLFGNPTKSEQIILYLLFLLACTTHFSHINFSLALLFCFALFFRKRSAATIAGKPVLWLFLLTALSFLPMLVAYSKSKHVFLMGAMVEHGIVKEYLDAHCAEKKFVLCASKDSLDLKAWEFIWGADSPLNSSGGWAKNKREYNEIIYGTLTEPRFIFLHIKESVKATAAQLLHFGIADGNGIFLEGTLLYARIQNYFSHETSRYAQSRQNRGEFLSAAGINKIFTLVVIASITAFLVILLKGALGAQAGTVTLFLLFGIIINAWVCGTFSTVIDRYGCKVMWLLPFSSLLGILSYFHRKKNEPE